jgi:hypothetical protein
LSHPSPATISFFLMPVQITFPYHTGLLPTCVSLVSLPALTSPQHTTAAGPSGMTVLYLT